MTKTQRSENFYATCVAIGGSGIMMTGPSGSGKSDLALRLIDRGAKLVSDDYVKLSRDGDLIVVEPPTEIAGKMEIWSLGIFEMDFVSDVPLDLQVRLGSTVERFPMDSQMETILDRPVTTIGLNANESSAPIKVEMALMRLLKARKEP